MSQLTLNAEDLALCQSIMKKHGVSYAFATRFFPPEKRAATAVLYAFFRKPDDVVDDANGSLAEKRAALLAWNESWSLHASGRADTDPILRAAAAVFAQYRIPTEYGQAFLAAMFQDLEVSRYATYADLVAYMYGSAAVVGFMMSYVIGFKHADTLKYAQALGEAMQLTNFLRDIKEDLLARGRVYLPMEDLERFQVTVEDLERGVVTPGIKALLQFECSRARALYALADDGIKYLDPSGQLAVRVASGLYAAILDRIKAADYDVFTKRRRTTLLHKLFLTYKIWKKQASTQ